jgi:beta-xylosidase
MTNTAYQIWETFKAELTQPATDDMKEALASSIRVISSIIHRVGVIENEPWHFYIAQELNEYADELEAL